MRWESLLKLVCTVCTDSSWLKQRVGIKMVIILSASSKDFVGLTLLILTHSTSDNHFKFKIIKFTNKNSI